MSFDRFVAALFSARGKFWENGAVCYYHRDRGMPLDNLANNARIFLGVPQPPIRQVHPDRFLQNDGLSHNMDATGIYAFQQNRLVADKIFKARVSETYLMGAGRGAKFPRPVLDSVEDHIARHSKKTCTRWRLSSCSDLSPKSSCKLGNQNFVISKHATFLLSRS